MTAERRTLSRRESKALTRRRLLDAALGILDAEGEAALTTTSVTREAAVAQSTFYVHFDNVDDLLVSLVDELAGERRRLTRDARRMSRADPGDVERLRETYRIPLADLLAHPRIFRLVLRSRHDPSSPLGEWSRGLYEGSRRALVEDLVAAGMAADTPEEGRRAEMVADGIIALTESLALGHLEGRYPDVEEIIDVLVTFSRGYRPLLRRGPGGAGG